MMEKIEGLGARPAAPDVAPDAVARYTYGGQLEASAEAFLISAFDQADNSVLGEQNVSGVLVSAAMHILTRTAWTQPTDEQVKASMFLRTQARQAS